MWCLYIYIYMSLINNITKIFEKCLKSRLLDFFEKYKILAPKQYGFRQKKYSEMAVFELVNLINNQINGQSKCFAVYLDLAKAFDTVPHAKLIERANDLGIRIIKNYLKDKSAIC